METAARTAERGISQTSWREHMRRLRRRSITIPVLTIVTGALLASLPFALPLLALADVTRPTRPWARCRALVSLSWIAFCEVVGVVASFALWLLFVLHRNPGRFQRHNSALQRVWTTSLFAGARWIFQMRLETSGLENAAHGPMILLVRHASLVDTVLTAAVLANPHRLRLRYVLKDELLNDPCIDIVGNRLPNVFVSRSSKNKDDVDKVRSLAANLQSDEGVLIYPEGTRFSPAKLKTLQARLVDDPIAGPNAAALRNVLPPRPGGTLTLLQNAPAVDVVVLAHRGLEGAATLGDFWRGELVGTTLRVCATRYAASELPPEARLNPEWLMQRWRDVDQWLSDCEPG